MKILYLRLLNSAGIYAGTSKRKIEIDFTKGNNNIVMLFGGNGSGKSTIISSLHPFNSTCNDERDKFFIDGKEGEKEIHYQLDDKVYMIRHYVSAKNKTKSYIAKMDYNDYLSKNESKDELADKYGEELNENGGVLTFKDLVEIHLGVDEEFFKISRIGSNVTNFIDLSTANRKKYISTFLPNIDEYLQRYKIVNDKHKVMTKEIKYLSDEILKLDDEDTLNLEKTRLEKQLDSLRKSIEKCSNKIATAKATVVTLDKDGILKAAKYENPYALELSKLEKEKIKIDDVISCYDLEEVEKKLSNIETTLNNIEKLIVQTKEKIGNEKENLGNILVDINSKKKQIDGMSVTDIENLRKIETKNLNTLYILTEELANVNLSKFNINSIDSKAVPAIALTMKQLYKAMDSTESKISIEYRNILDKIFVSKLMTWKEFIGQIESYKTNIASKEKERKALEKKLSEANSNKRYLTILEQRPSECITDSCPFISTALKYKNVESEIEELTESIETIDNELDTLHQELNIFESVKDLVWEIEKTYNSYKDGLPYLNEVLNDVKFDSFDSLMKYFLTTLKTDRRSLLYDGSENLKTFVSLNEEISGLKKDNEVIQDKIKANESITNIHNELTKELSELESKKNDISKNIAKYNLELAAHDGDKEELEKQKATNTFIKELFTKANDFLTNYNEVKEKFENTEKILSEISDLATVVAENKDEKESYTQQLPLIEAALDKVKIKINKLKEYTDRKKILEDNYEKTSWIKDALNPTKGIPVYFIENYLDKTKFITNNLLDISQNGRFAIAFEVTDKDFYIKVYKNNGDILNDISQASQGETALTSLSLSLALIEQSMKKYNIFLLDELDGALDATNRRCFIDMVQSQMKVLNSEQVFIISHNNEFENIPIDMILLKDNNIDVNNKDFMTNKTVLFKV